MHRQDGNALAVWFGVTQDDGSAGTPSARLLANLKSNWVERGSVSPEWLYQVPSLLLFYYNCCLLLSNRGAAAGAVHQGKGAIGTFPGSMEVNNKRTLQNGLEQPLKRDDNVTTASLAGGRTVNAHLSR